MDLKQLMIATVIVFFVLAITKQEGTSEAMTHKDSIVFNCKQSPDGICYTADSGIGDCYTSGGTPFGSCKLNDTVYPKQDPTICREGEGSCPNVVDSNVASSVLAQAPELYSFTYEDGVDLYEGFCFKDRCYTYSGSPFNIHNTLMTNRNSIARCYPALDEGCPTTSSMVTVVVKEGFGTLHGQAGS